jgi:thiol-disulfide isomerase/thioredoxin
LLFFFTTWCGPCKKALGELAKWEKKHRVPVIVVSKERKEKISTWLAGWKKKKPRRIALDPRGLLTDALQVTKFPTTILVDGEGKITYRRSGFNPKLKP